MGGMMHTTQECRIGDAYKLLGEMPDESVDTVITSPPYWGLRDYGVDGQIGLESTLEEYHERLLEVTAELWRVLKPTGVMFINHGDSYGGNQGRGTGKRNEHEQMVPQKNTATKCLTMQNERLIIRMIDEQGWILRNRIIWNKPNGMPSSVTDRFSNKYEPVYMLVKSNDINYYYNSKTGAMQRDKPLGTRGEEGIDWDWRDVISENCITEEVSAETKKVSHWRGHDYWFDLDAVRVLHKDSSNSRWKNGGESTDHTKFNKTRPNTAVGNLRNASNPLHKLGKNPGDVWTIPTQPYPESHFATFPTALIEPIIKAACPAEICPVCGLARERIVDREFIPQQDVSLERGIKGAKGQKPMDKSNHWEGVPRGTTSRHTTGWTSCNCGADYIAGTVLDPFCGSGTVLEVCRLLNRNAIGFELNPEYEPLIHERSMAHTPPLTAYEVPDESVDPAINDGEYEDDGYNGRY